LTTRLTNLTRVQARGVEQAIMEQRGLARYGRTLINKFNGIALEPDLHRCQTVGPRQAREDRLSVTDA